jgi:hypothetical protein
METYPKVRAVEPLPHKRLRVTFAEGTVKVYDCSPLLDEPAFGRLNDDTLFRHVRADTHGFGVVWNDELDLAESELWIHGMVECPAEPSSFRS